MGVLATGYAAVYLGPSQTSVSASSTAPTSDADWFGCPSAYVCIYTQGLHDNLDSADITAEYYTYGPDALQRQYGWHWVLNNQINGAHVKLCTAFSGSGTCQVIDAHNRTWTNLTRINSIVLYP